MERAELAVRIDRGDPGPDRRLIETARQYTVLLEAGEELLGGVVLHADIDPQPAPAGDHDLLLRGAQELVVGGAHGEGEPAPVLDSYPIRPEPPARRVQQLPGLPGVAARRRQVGGVGR